MTTSHTHLGDGAYASFDGFAFGFAANDHRNTSVVLGENEMLALARFVRGQYPGLAKAMSNLLLKGEQS